MMKPTTFLLIYVLILLTISLFYIVYQSENFVDSQYNLSNIDPTVPENQRCSALIRQMFPEYKFSEEAENIIGTLKPDVTTTLGVIGIEPNMNFQCIIPNYPFNPMSMQFDDGSSFIDTSSDLKMFNMNVQPRFDGNIRCVGQSLQGDKQVDLPYRDEHTSIKGCTINVTDYIDRPHELEQHLKTLYDISREGYETIRQGFIKERDELLAYKNQLEGVNSSTLQQANLWEKNANNTREDIRVLQEQINRLRERIRQLESKK